MDIDMGVQVQFMAVLLAVVIGAVIGCIAQMLPYCDDSCIKNRVRINLRSLSILFAYGWSWFAVSFLQETGAIALTVSSLFEYHLMAMLVFAALYCVGYFSSALLGEPISALSNARVLKIMKAVENCSLVWIGLVVAALLIWLI